MEPSQISYMYIIFPLWGTAKIIITTIRLRFHRLLLAVMMLMDDDDEEDMEAHLTTTRQDSLGTGYSQS